MKIAYVLMVVSHLAEESPNSMIVSSHPIQSYFNMETCMAGMDHQAKLQNPEDNWMIECFEFNKVLD